MGIFFLCVFLFFSVCRVECLDFELAQLFENRSNDDISSWTEDDWREFVAKTQTGVIVDEFKFLAKNCSSNQPDDWPCLLQKCYPPNVILSQALERLAKKGDSINNGTNGREILLLQDLCPPLLLQALSGSCNQKTVHVPAVTERKKPTTAEVWWYGMLLVTGISSCSIVGAAFLPFISMRFYQGFMTLLIGLAMGSLLSSALFHLLPQAFRATEVFEGHAYLYSALGAILGIYVFLLIENILKAVLVWRKARNENSSAVDSEASLRDKDFQYIGENNRKSFQMVASSSSTCSAALAASSVDEEDNNKEASSLCQESLIMQDDCHSGTESETRMKAIYRSQEKAMKASFGHPERPRRLSHVEAHKEILCLGKNSKENPDGDKSIATIAWMVIVGDGFHNFIDGVSIGTAFSESILIGISVSVAVICEEFPHELGDLAVLLNSGMSMKQALLYNFLSALFCYLGLVLGILLGNLTESACAIFGVAGGIFLYIALADMVPEMNESAESAGKLGFWNWLKTIILQSIGFAMGVIFLFLMAYYQDSLDFSKFHS